jgi:predicted protein tyrosine phosphatase
MPSSKCVAPTLAMVKKALAFTRGLSGTDRLLVHCGHGVSRSPAVALAIFAQDEPTVSERDLFHRVLDLRPYAAPNSLIIAHADRLLKRGGRLSEAILGR